jgi:fructosamine-3-kinase
MLKDIPADVLEAVTARLHVMDIRPLDFSFMAGGCINPGGRLRTSSRDLFLKWNDAPQLDAMFAAEARGLQLLRDTHTIAIPEVVGTGAWQNKQFLLLEFMHQVTPVARFWADFGEHLAALHRVHSDLFGLDHDNYLGSLVQSNGQHVSGVDFFVSQRLRVQVKLAIDAGYLDKASAKQFETLYKKLPSLLPDEKPCLVHGDLWRGNLIGNNNGRPCLIDPAVYYGSREVDLAMTRLFGGFDATFYAAYQEVNPLTPGFAERVDLYNLYPLLAHLNLFGQAYRAQIDGILRRYR